MVGDATALEQVLAEDFILVDVLNGDVVPRAGLLEVLRAGDLVFMSSPATLRSSTGATGPLQLGWSTRARAAGR